MTKKLANTNIIIIFVYVFETNQSPLKNKTMKIYNTTTEKEVSLTIIDRNTGCEWTNDLIGNAGDLHYNSDREMAEMSQEDYEWWSNTIEGLEKIEDLTEEAKELLSSEDFEELEEKLRNEGNANDYEQHIATLTAILNEVIEENK